MSDTINLVKLCVGVDSPEALLNWRTAQKKKDPGYLPRHVTRMWPKRQEALLNGGSLYWVFKGQILARQRVTALEEVLGQDGITRCGICLDPELIRTVAAPRRPFQGWRYLEVADSPADLPKAREKDDALPPEMAAALADLGLR